MSIIGTVALLWSFAINSNGNAVDGCPSGIIVNQPPSSQANIP
jgi:hypothetical protein